LGALDFVTIIEAPDNETIAHLSVDLGSRGTAKIQTLPAIPIEALTAKLKGDQQLGRYGVRPSSPRAVAAPPGRSTAFVS
jgi:hypothetical protein